MAKEPFLTVGSNITLRGELIAEVQNKVRKFFSELLCATQLRGVVAPLRESTKHCQDVLLPIDVS